ncbi:MAG: hypothetical protein H6Q18_1065 [Bacteroidetes bacterium]|nr:hypothetical protein [Bacteroidota bacterium]
MKKLFFNLFVVSMAILSFNLVSCKGEEETKKDSIDLLIEQGVLRGELNHEVTLNASVTYSLAGTFIVKDGATLNIPAGTKIKATQGFNSYILVLQGGKLNVSGTAAKPVIMTAEDESYGSGFWGGIVINGKAKISGASGITATGTCEMNTEYSYGGNNDADNSGTITYLIVKYAGARSSAEVEHNGITLDAVGSGTKIENIYILESADDGIEFFGGSVNVKNILVVNSDDDMFDNTQGYTGTLENCYGIWEQGYKSSEADPRGVESDGNLDGKTPSDINQTVWTLNNMTIDLKLAKGITPDVIMQDVIKIRRGAKATITNALVKGTGAIQDLADCTDSKGDAAAGTSINISATLTGYPTVDLLITKKGVNNALINPTLSGNTGCSSSIFSWTGYSF